MPPNWARIGGLSPIPHSPLFPTELRGAAPSFRKAREAEAEPGLSFPAAAELGLHRELPVSVQIHTGSGPDRQGPQKLLKGRLAAALEVARG